MGVHTIPLNDEREHEQTTDCWCDPTVIWIDPKTGLPWANGGPMVVHNAADCREACELITGEAIEPGKGWIAIET